MYIAKVCNSNPKSKSGGFERALKNEALAEIFTKVQSTVISIGTELERIISKMSNTIKDLDAFLESCDNGTVKDGTYLCTKKAVKASKYKLEKHEPDFIVFTISPTKKECYVVELKDGDDFDTKKSLAEKEMLTDYVKHLAPQIAFRTRPYICSFNQSDKEAIVNGFKRKFTIDEVMTGREFCEILDIDYDAIVKMRKKDAEDNFKYVIEKIFEIKEVKEYLKKLQSK